MSSGIATIRGQYNSHRHEHRKSQDNKTNSADYNVTVSTEKNKLLNGIKIIAF
jgi:hypothetical protein